MNQDASTGTPTRAKSNAALYRWIALFVLLAATIGGVLLYWRHTEIYPSTDNAYTGANIVRVASQVSGPIVRVYVVDDDKVAAGDPLFDIDPALYGAALRNARAQFDAAADAAGTAADDLKAAADKLEEKRAALEDALGKYRDAKDAQKEGEPPSQATIDALKAWHDAMQAYEDAKAEFTKAQDAKITVTTPTVQLRGAAAQLDKATHERVRTHVTAPGSGWVTNSNLRPGSIVQAGTPALRPGRGRPLVGRRQFQGNRSRPHQAWPARHHQPRHVSRHQARRRSGSDQRGLRRDLLRAAARERHRKLGQGHPALPGADQNHRHARC